MANTETVRDWNVVLKELQQYEALLVRALSMMRAESENAKNYKAKIVELKQEALLAKKAQFGTGHDTGAGNA